MKAIIESLERSDRVRHVYVHAGGKIEALGNSADDNELYISNDDAATLSNDNTLLQNSGCHVRAVCVVDIRENKAIDQTKLKNSLRPLLIVNDNEYEVGIDNKSLKSKPKKLYDAAAIQKKKQDKMIKEITEKQNFIKEQGWTGRAGGIQVQGNAKNTSLSRSPTKRRHHMIDQKKELPLKNSSVPDNDQEMIT